jgi:flagellar biosynthesis chaperone FliJ
MALTLEQLSDLVEILQKRVETLETEVKQYRQDIIELEQQLSQSITTQKLVVQGDAQIAGRNILTDGQMLDAHESRLNSHDGTLNAHESRLNSHDGTLNAHESRLNSHDGTLNAHESRLNSHDGTLNAHEGRLNSHDGTLNAHEGRLNAFAQSISIPGDIQFGATLSTPGRMHISGGELLFILNKNGVIIGREWGGNGDLVVQGNLVVGGSISYAGTIHDTNPGPHRDTPYRDRPVDP